MSEEEEVQIIEPWESEQSYSKYTRRPIAGLAPEYYGKVNIPRYYTGTAQLGNDSSKKLVMWKKKKRETITYLYLEMTSSPMNKTNMKVLCLAQFSK